MMSYNFGGVKGLRICSRCGSSETLMRGQIERWYASDDGLLCCKCYGAIHGLTHPEINRKWQAANKDYVKDFQKAWRDRTLNYQLNKTQMTCSICSRKLFSQEVGACKRCKQKFDKWRVWRYI